MTKKSLALLLNELCTTDQLHTLLKGYKEEHKKDIKLSGSKSDLIENTLSGMEKEIIPFEKVFKLIQDSEEYGSQYIYLYKVLNPSLISFYNAGEKIKEKILNGVDFSKFPKTTLIPSELEWVDFRVPNRGVNNSWLGKLYDKKEKEVKEKDFIDPSSGKRTVVYKTDITRVIYQVYWDGKETLEYKVSRTAYDSSMSLRESLMKIQRKVKSTVDSAKHFRKVNLTETINKFLLSYKEHKEIYCLLSTQLKDSHEGTATIRIFNEDIGDLFSDTSRKSAIEAYMNNSGNGTGIVVRFLKAGSKGELERDINVILGRDDINQIIIQPKISPKEYRYVRRKIKEFS
ncbi:hypothetical protein TPENAI_20046 [Tenacibaculum litopenaei]|uniref:hypothetical protein n=1 Tax=Tenacibaculum litopenaei TaxID=396016 RepID=UPI00389619ED